MTPFIDKIKFPLWNLNINNLMLINFHSSLITKRFFWSFDRHSDKTLYRSELLPNIKKIRNKISERFTNVFLNCLRYCDTCLECYNFIQEILCCEFIPFFFFNGSQNWVHLRIFGTPWSSVYQQPRTRWSLNNRIWLLAFSAAWLHYCRRPQYEQLEKYGFTKLKVLILT